MVSSNNEPPKISKTSSSSPSIRTMKTTMKQQFLYPITSVLIIILASFTSNNLAQELCSTTDTLNATNEPTIRSQHQQHYRHQVDIDNNHEGSNLKVRYIDEQAEDTDVINDVGLVDERLANSHYELNSVRAFEHDFYNFNVGNDEANREIKRQVAGSKVNDELCGLHLRQMLELMDDLESKLEARRSNNEQFDDSLLGGLNESHHRLAMVLDSFGRYDAGTLAGRTHFPGSYSQCHGTQLLLLLDGNKNSTSKKNRTRARYCTARLRNDRYLNSNLRLKVRAKYQPDSLMFVGICLPESCHSKSFDNDQRSNALIKRLVDSQFKLPKFMFLDENLDLESIYCSPDDDSSLVKIPISGQMFILAMTLWFGALFYVNCFRGGKCPEEFPAYKRLFTSLDLRRVWREFTLADQEATMSQRKEARVQLDTLNPIKVIGCLMVVLGHSFFIISINSMDLLKTYMVIERDPWTSFMTGVTVVVDTFYLITGLLITYITMIKVNNMKNFRSASTLLEHSINALKLASMRYLRLVPLYFLVFWFKRSVFSYIGSGPMWDHGINRDTVIGGCKNESWLSPFTLMAAYLPLSNQCLPHCWSVANDIAACFILFPLLILLSRKPVMAMLACMLIILSSSLLMWRSMLDLGPEMRHEIRDIRIHALTQLFARASYVYTMPQNRIFAVLVGSFAGYALYQYNLNTKLKEWPNWFKGIATKLSFANIILILGTGAVIPYLRELGQLESIQGIIEPLNSVGRLFWTVANAIIFLRMTTDWKANFLMSCGANRIWKTLAMLNYVIFMIHVDVIHYSITSRTNIVYYSRFNVISSFASTYLISLALGTIIHVTLENPIDKLISSYLLNLTKPIAGESKQQQAPANLPKGPPSNQSKLEVNKTNDKCNSMKLD